MISGIKAIYIGQLSASFETDGAEPYFASASYDVFLNGRLAVKDVKTNVFSVYGLKPDTGYKLKAGSGEVSFRTRAASLIMHISDFSNPSRSEDDTLMFQLAIAALPENGILYVDPGEYHVTSLFLKSGMTLYLSKRAVVFGQKKIDSYPLAPGELPYSDPGKNKLQLMAWEGSPCRGKPSLINAYFAHDIDIAGEGVLDGQAHDSGFWDDPKHLEWARPRMIFLDNCQRVNVQGITLRDSPSWTIHPYFSEDLGFYDLKIYNPKDAPNTDGMDPECSSGIRIAGVYFSVGDDCIALKSGKMYIGSAYKHPCADVEIRNCYMHEGHGAIVLGSEVGAGVKDIKVEKCLFEKTDRGFRIKTRRGRGRESVIDGVVFSDIVMRNVLTPLVINMFYFCDPDGKTEYVYSKEKLPVDDRTPYLGSFVFERIRAYDAEYALGWFYGLPEMPIGSVVIRDSEFTVKENAGSGYPAMMSFIPEKSKAGFFFFNVGSAVLDHVRAEGYLGDKATLENVGSYKEI